MDWALHLLEQLCLDLRQLRLQAGGPSLRDLAGLAGISKSQLGSILSAQVRRLPDCRITTYFDSMREAQRFKIRHGRLATHILFVEEGAVENRTYDELMLLLDRAVELMRQTTNNVEVLVTRHGIRGG